MSFTEKLLFIFSVVTKTQLKTRKIHRTKLESLELLDTSKANFLIQIDGESILRKENKLIINIKKKALRVITPKL
jgi:diacylglycerol kinase family enzyme